MASLERLWRLRQIVMLLTCVSCTPPASKREVRLAVQVLYGDPQGRDNDGRSRQILASLPEVPHGAYTLRDEAMFHLEPHTAGRLQLPDRTWLNLTPEAITPSGDARLTVEMSGVQLRASVLMAVGSTLAIGGPPFGRGHIVVAVRYL